METVKKLRKENSQLRREMGDTLFKIQDAGERLEVAKTYANRIMDNYSKMVGRPVEELNWGDLSHLKHVELTGDYKVFFNGRIYSGG